MLLLSAVALTPAMLLPPAGRSYIGAQAAGNLQMVAFQGSMKFKSAAAEEKYWREWFWNQAEAELDADPRFASASKRDLKRIREYIACNRDEAPLPKKLRKNPQYEVIGGYFPGLLTTPFHDATAATWQGVANAYPAIKEELERLISEEQQFVDVGKPLGWRTMPVFYKGEAHPDFPAERCPQTMAMLSSLRLAGETVAFQRQSPGTGLPRHVDPCSWVIACHLGIACPDGGADGKPYISVAGEKYHWQDGRVMVFDPSFKHETFNPTSEERIILNIDVFHPELTDLECEAIKMTIALKKKLFGSTEEEVHVSRR